MINSDGWLNAWLMFDFFVVVIRLGQWWASEFILSEAEAKCLVLPEKQIPFQWVCPNPLHIHLPEAANEVSKDKVNYGYVIT